MREKLINLLNSGGRCDKYGENGCDGCEYKYADEKCEEHLTTLMADDLIKNGVAIVVRCKDCIHWETGYRYCRRIGVNFNGDSPVGMNDYCSYGERKTN